MASGASLKDILWHCANWKRQAQIYVFCVLGEKEQRNVDPLDVRQWRFHVLATQVLNDRLGEQETLTLGSLLRLKHEKVTHGDITGAVEQSSRARSSR